MLEKRESEVNGVLFISFGSPLEPALFSARARGKTVPRYEHAEGRGAPRDKTWRPSPSVTNVPPQGGDGLYYKVTESNEGASQPATTTRNWRGQQWGSQTKISDV